MKIGIFGGAFNPVHEMHVLCAKAAAESLKLDKLIVVPTKVSPHKNTPLAPAEHRINMLKIAFKGFDGVEVSDFEISQAGKSYSFITAEHFREEYKSAQLFLIVGADMLSDFFTWKNPERILAAATLVSFGRDGYFVSDKTLKEKFEKTFGTDYIKIPFSGEDVSSAEIRAYMSLGLKPAGINAEVFDYIVKNDVYPADKYSDYVKRALPEKRRIHTANVVACAMKKAKELGLSEEKVRIAATLHDCAKYDDAKKYKGFSLPTDVPPPVAHAFLGAFVAENVLGINDREIIDAIKYHTSGKAGMSTLSKLIFVADMLEKGRDYEEVNYLRDLYEKDFDECFKRCVEEETKHLIAKKQYIYKETLSAYEYYVTEEKI